MNEHAEHFSLHSIVEKWVEMLVKLSLGLEAGAGAYKLEAGA